MTHAQKSLLLSKISTMEKMLMDAIKEQRRQAKLMEKLMQKKIYQTEWLTKSEFKELTGIESDGTIYQLINKKAFTVRERGKRRFNRASVIEWMGEKKSKSELVEEYNKKLRAA